MTKMVKTITKIILYPIPTVKTVGYDCSRLGALIRTARARLLYLYLSDAEG